MNPMVRLALVLAVSAAASGCTASPSPNRATPELPARETRRGGSEPPAPGPTAKASLPSPERAARSSLACAHPSPDPNLHVVSPDGRVTVFVAIDPARTVATSVEDLPHQDLCVEVSGEAPRVLVAGREAGPNEGVERTLAGFGNLLFSRDGELLFFTSAAWVTSTAAHVVEVSTGRETFLFDGAVEVEVSKGPDVGRYVASHFRLDDVYPVSSPKYRGRMVMWSLVTRTGKTLRKLSEVEAQRMGADVSGS